MSHLSKGYTAADCSANNSPMIHGAVAEVDCQQNHTQGGPAVTEYALFANAADMNAAFTDWVTHRLTVVPFPDGSKGPKPWDHGQQALANSRRNIVYMLWTNNDTRTLAIANTMGDAAGLYTWWQANR